MWLWNWEPDDLSSLSEVGNDRTSSHEMKEAWELRGRREAGSVIPHPGSATWNPKEPMCEIQRWWMSWLNRKQNKIKQKQNKQKTFSELFFLTLVLRRKNCAHGLKPMQSGESHFSSVCWSNAFPEKHPPLYILEWCFTD